MSLFTSLIIASLVGTGIWLAQTALKPITQKVFSQTWHYYTGLIPVFFLLGGTEIMTKAIGLWRVGITTANHSLLPGQMTGVYTVSEAATNMLQHNDLAIYATWIWFMGAAVFLAVNVSKYRTFRAFILQNSRAWDLDQHPVKIMISPAAPTPMLMGFWNPIVVLPDTDLSETELAMIMSHELVHLKRGDLFVKLAMLIANALHWFNPASYLLNKQMLTLCELSCDETVVQQMDTENRRSYGETLLSMLAYGTMQKNVIGVSGLSGSKRSIKRRLSNLMDVKKTKKPIFLLSLVTAVAAIVLGGIAAYAATPPTPPSPTVSPSVPTFEDGGGRNINVEYGDGTKEQFDNDGNVTIQYPDGRMESFDKNGNPIPLIPFKPRGSEPPREMTLDEIKERVKMHREKGLPVPLEYLGALNES